MVQNMFNAWKPLSESIATLLTTTLVASATNNPKTVPATRVSGSVT